MNSGLNLSLNEGGDNREGRKGLYILLALTVIIAAATLVTVIMLNTGRGGITGNRPAGRLEKLALKLEKRDLGTEAAGVWKEYLEIASPGIEESGKIWYRIGKIYQENGEYASALAAFYRAESFGPLEGLEHELSVRITESLEMMGKFNALESELAERTSISGEEEKGEVVAEIGSRKITDAEIKERIEEEIDSALEGAAPGLAGSDRNRQKEMMIEKGMKPENRRQYLSSYIAEELIYREAVKARLHRDPAFREMVENKERALLVRRYLNRLYGDRINITEDMLREYYERNRESFAGEEGRVLPFEDVVQQVYAGVRMREENRVQQELMNRLREKYDVVIHNSRLGAPADSLGSRGAEQ